MAAFDLRAKRDLNRGFNDAFSRGIELALIPLVFGGLGWLVDNALGTSPGFTIGLVLFAFVGMGARMWIGYDAQMRRHEEELGLGRTRTLELENLARHGMSLRKNDEAPR